MATTFGIVLEKSMQLAHMKDYLQSKLETKINNCQPKYPVLQPWPRGTDFQPYLIKISDYNSKYNIYFKIYPR